MRPAVVRLVLLAGLVGVAATASAQVTLASILAVAAIPAQEPQPWMIRTTEHFEIYHQPQAQGHVDAVAREAEAAYDRIRLALRHELAATMPLILVPEDRDLPRSEEDARTLVTASGAPPRDHLLLSAETFARHPESTLAHELTHQFVFELLPRADRDAPWVSEALPDHQAGVWDPLHVARLRQAATQGRVPRVADLTAADRHWGHAVLDFIAAEFGGQGIRRYVASLQKAEPARGDTIRTAFDVSSDDFDAGFRAYVRARFAGH